jgi:hypothetical protein
MELQFAILNKAVNKINPHATKNLQGIPAGSDKTYQ